ncbi:MAG: septum site-determining protein MinC [Spirulinaceae cyanobacterium]
MLNVKRSQVSLKSQGEQLQLILPSQPVEPGENNWSEVWLQLKHRLNGSEKFWQPGTKVHLEAENQLLDGRQLQAISDALQAVELKLEKVYTSRRQTAVAAATVGYCVEQNVPASSFTSAPEANDSPPWAEPLYLQTTIRSGVEIRHPGTVIVLGDVNPGGAIIAAGDIFVWGHLRGIAHAGSQGNRQCRIMALQMKPTQLRIADDVARGPAQNPQQLEPELAYVTKSGIHLTKALDFMRTHSFADQKVGWTNS